LLLRQLGAVFKTTLATPIGRRRRSHASFAGLG